MIEFVKSKPLLSFVFLVLLIGRLSISGKGYLEDSDEVDYYIAEDAFDAIIHGNLKDYFRLITLTEGKPTQTLIQTALVPFHRIWSFVINKSIHSSYGMVFWGFINIVVSLFLLFFSGRIYQKLNFSRESIVLGVYLLGALINFNIYTRHLLSYDFGLLILLIALDKLLAFDTFDKNHYIIIGALCAFGFTTYHGNFMLLAIIGAYVLWQATDKRDFLLKTKALAKGFVFIFAFYEVLFWFGGSSFILEAMKIGGTISQGSYSEGFIYLFIYFFNVEKILGIGLLILFFISIFLIIKDGIQGKAEKLILLSVVAYLLYAFAVYVLMKFVFYGRILHMFYPFVVLGAILVLDRVQFFKKKLTYFGIISTITIAYCFNILEMNSFTYPRKVLEEFNLQEEENKGRYVEFKYELDNIEDYLNRDRHELGVKHENKLDAGNYVVLNTCFFRHHPDEFINSYQAYQINSKDEMEVFSKLHFQSHIFYTFEYCSLVGRRFYLSKDLKIRILKKNE